MSKKKHKLPAETPVLTEHPLDRQLLRVLAKLLHQIADEILRLIG